MKLRILLSLIVLLALGFSLCKKLNVASIKQIKIIPEQAKPIHLKMIFDSIEYIPLQMSGINSVVDMSNNCDFSYDGERFYFLQILPDLKRKVVVFKKDGTFDFWIDGKEQGPGSFPTAYDFLVDSKNGSIEVLERVKRKVVYFDLKGQLQGETKTENIFQQFVKIDDNYVFYCGNSYVDEYRGANVVHIDMRSNTATSFLPIRDGLEGFELSDRVFSPRAFNYSFLHWQLFDPDIYRIGEFRTDKEIDIDFNGCWIPKKLVDNFGNMEFIDQMNVLNNGDYIVTYNQIIESEKNIFFTYFYKKELYWNFYNKKNNSVSTFKVGKINNIKNANDFDGGLALGVPSTIFGDKLVFILYPPKVTEYFESNKSSITEKSSLKHNATTNISDLANVKQEDNPVIVIAKLNKDWM